MNKNLYINVVRYFSLRLQNFFLVYQYCIDQILLCCQLTNGKYVSLTVLRLLEICTRGTFVDQSAAT